MYNFSRSCFFYASRPPNNKRFLSWMKSIAEPLLCITLKLKACQHAELVSSGMLLMKKCLSGYKDVKGVSDIGYVEISRKKYLQFSKWVPKACSVTKLSVKVDQITLIAKLVTGIRIPDPSTHRREYAELVGMTTSD